MRISCKCYGIDDIFFDQVDRFILDTDTATITASDEFTDFRLENMLKVSVGGLTVERFLSKDTIPSVCLGYCDKNINIDVVSTDIIQIGQILLKSKEDIKFRIHCVAVRGDFFEVILSVSDIGRFGLTISKFDFKIKELALVNVDLIGDLPSDTTLISELDVCKKSSHILLHTGYNQLIDSDTFEYKTKYQPYHIIDMTDVKWGYLDNKKLYFKACDNLYFNIADKVVISIINRRLCVDNKVILDIPCFEFLLHEIQKESGFYIFKFIVDCTIPLIVYIDDNTLDLDMLQSSEFLSSDERYISRAIKKARLIL